MSEREYYKHVLQKVIAETENEKIKTSEELIQALIFELTELRRTATD
ncbi:MULTISPECIES: hypothetical protein [unclassified Virgibacillus]|nr:hypothetical protein [Virgibacillus sp. LDC-1]